MSRMDEKLDFIGGGLMNIILGALILWVGQTTFQHAGKLASVDEKFTAVDHQFEDVEKRQEALRKWIEKVSNGIKDDKLTMYTTSDAEKQVAQIRRLDEILTRMERRLTDRLTDVEVKLAAVETRDRDGQKLAELQMEMAQLRAAVAGGAAYGPAESPYQPAANVAQRMPVYLPPVGTRR
jgi:hypothetical protein